jgi:hypothetical protein
LPLLSRIGTSVRRVERDGEKHSLSDRDGAQSKSFS